MSSHLIYCLQDDGRLVKRQLVVMGLIVKLSDFGRLVSRITLVLDIVAGFEANLLLILK